MFHLNRLMSRQQSSGTRRKRLCSLEVAPLEERALLSKITVFQPETSTFFINNQGAVQFGQGRIYGGNPIPIPADYTGEGDPELAIFQPETSTFFIKGKGAIQFGQGSLYGGNPVPIPAKFHGHHKVDLAVYQPSTSVFYIQGKGAIQFGQGSLYGGRPIPVVGDFDGDGTDDFGVFQPATSTFYLHESTAGDQTIRFGQGVLYGGNPAPIIGDFDGDGTTDLGVFQPTTSTFYLHESTAGDQTIQFGQGTLFGGNPNPVTDDFNDDGTTDLAVYQPNTSTYYVRNVGTFLFGQGRLYGGSPHPVVLAADPGTSNGTDITPPMTTATLLGHHNHNGIYSGPVTVVLTAQDPDDQPSDLTIHYRIDGGPWQTDLPPVLSDNGQHLVQFYATDPSGNFGATRSIYVTINALSNPAGVGMNLHANPNILWPPNHKLVPVQVTGTLNDPNSVLVTPLTLSYQVRDEYGLASETNVGIPYHNDGRFHFTVYLDASRDGHDKNGRHYWITVTARDAAGNTISDSTFVLVPHDNGHGDGKGGDDKSNNHGKGHGHGH